MAEPLYDVALSFASDQRDYVRSVASALAETGLTYFFDEDRRVDLWGRNLLEELDRTYRINAGFVVMFVSTAYAEKVWPNLERQSAQSRAMSEVEPYVLPVRFDDTELPGLLPTIFYQDARTMTPAELASLIEVKVAMSKSDNNAEDRDLGWEYLVFIDELASGIAGYDREKYDFDLGVARPKGPALSLDDVAEDLLARSRTARKIVANLDRLLNDTALTSAFGPPGEPGDADRIRHVAAAVVDVYGAMLHWASETRGALAPEEAEPVYLALSDFVRTPLRQIRDFVEEMDNGVRPAIEALRAGDKPEEPVRLTFTLTLTIDEEATSRFEAELTALSASM